MAAAARSGRRGGRPSDSADGILGYHRDGSGATTAHFPSARCGCIGAPLPGVTLKLVPAGAKLELRLTGPNVSPGYHANPEATGAAFDEEGFYRPGDAARLADPGDPSQGLMFDGRLSEDFKLITGIWVHVGALRTSLVSECGGLLSDAVIAGADRECVAALAWVNQAQARGACASTGSSSAIRRLLLLAEPPQIDAGEITEKGYIIQRAVIERRAPLGETLFAHRAGGELITPVG